MGIDVWHSQKIIMKIFNCKRCR